MEAISSSRDGILATAETPAGSSPVPRHGAAEDHELVVVLGELIRDLGRSDGILGIGEHGHAREESGDRCGRRSFEGDLGERVLGNADRTAGFAHLRAEALHFRNRETRVVVRRRPRQSFRRSGRVPRPLSLSGLYPQFHSKFGGLTLRLSSAGARGPGVGSLRVLPNRPRRPRSGAEELFISRLGQELRTLRSTHRLGRIVRASATRAVAWTAGS